jgi:hypothetical protein
MNGKTRLVAMGNENGTIAFEPAMARDPIAALRVIRSTIQRARSKSDSLFPLETRMANAAWDALDIAETVLLTLATEVQDGQEI